MAHPEDEVGSSQGPTLPTPAEASAETLSAPSATPLLDEAAGATSEPAAAEEPSMENPAAPTAEQPAAKQPKVDPRPKPAYGEYAPEGWEWKPDTGEQDSGSAVHNAGGAVEGSHGSVRGAGGGAGGSTPAVPSTIPGVPHNLGAGSRLPGKRGSAPYVAPAQGGSDASRQENSAPAASSVAGTHQSGQSPKSSQAPIKPRGNADKIVTILLLAAGAVGSLNFSLAMMNIDKQFALLASAPGIDGFTPPAWLGTVGNITGLAVLAIYGVTLVYSIRRMRAGRLTFWVPLAVGVGVTVVLLIITLVAMLNSPGFIEIATDPEQTAKLLDYLQSATRSS